MVRQRPRDYTLWTLTLAYLLSQFFRSYVAVVAPQLIADYGFTQKMFGLFAGAFFLTFACAQIPLGLAFDRFGIGRPTVLCMSVGTGGAATLPLTHDPVLALASQAALGLGCAPIFMGLLNHVLVAGHGQRQVRTVTVASGIGIFGALIAALPLAWAATKIGWRPAMGVAAAAMALTTAAVTASLWRRPRAAARRKDLGQGPRRTRASNNARSNNLAFLTLLPVCFALSAGGTFRTSWGGPYFADVFALDTVARGRVMTAASVSALVVSLIIPLLVRRFSVKALSLAGLSLGILAAALLLVLPSYNALLSASLVCVLFSVGAIHPLVMSQARAISAASSLGLRLGILNSMVFLGVAVTSNCFGWLAARGIREGLPAPDIFARLFLFTMIVLVIGLATYVFSPSVQSEDSANVVRRTRPVSPVGDK
ncbi:MFS transporter [Paraburkholderia sp. MMS20-SJTN17]|uniref:MFS transporter n=1 Tax=Paraburkholderia translucens TaxID=2886945 RepID=A0ABS8KM45_9BURK|nr:MFS transporter [Paraburkholderia sp. MMS20-SJTN17]MCC8405834.1 MFS transporter [Paraburkholderia sp. MMS20-SJTN17]